MGLDYEIFKLGNVRLQRGGTLPDCKLAYKAFGKLSAAKDNVILYPTWYSGQHCDNEWLIGSGMALDPEKPQDTISSDRFSVAIQLAGFPQVLSPVLNELIQRSHGGGWVVEEAS